VPRRKKKKHHVLQNFEGKGGIPRDMTKKKEGDLAREKKSEKGKRGPPPKGNHQMEEKSKGPLDLPRKGNPGGRAGGKK